MYCTQKCVGLQGFHCANKIPYVFPILASPECLRLTQMQRIKIIVCASLHAMPYSNGTRLHLLHSCITYNIVQVRIMCLCLKTTVWYVCHFSTVHMCMAELWSIKRNSSSSSTVYGSMLTLCIVYAISEQWMSTAPKVYFSLNVL